VPAEDALGGDDQVVAVGLDDPEKEPWLAPQVAVQDDVAALVLEDAEVHGARVEIDAAVVSMPASVEAHGSPPGKDELFALSSFLPKAGRSRRGLYQYHTLRGGPGSRWRRMAETTGGSVRKARMLMDPPQAGQRSGRIS
jgi:hypothetical protein